MLSQTATHSVDVFHDFERHVQGVASRGVHQQVLKALVAVYAIMILSIWIFFARDLATGLDLAFGTFIFIVYFTLVIGGITLSDSKLIGERTRTLREYMTGPVDTNSGTMTGQAAAIQILFLPMCIMAFITTFGILVRIL